MRGVPARGGYPARGIPTLLDPLQAEEHHELGPPFGRVRTEKNVPVHRVSFWKEGLKRDFLEVAFSAYFLEIWASSTF